MNPLENLIRETIAENGPMSLETYMTLALAHPVHGYYASNMPLGEGGDFITAPEISQMFGELIGLWCVAVWRAMGEPRPFLLVELGPGRGSLMADALRAAQIAPDFLGRDRPPSRRDERGLAAMPARGAERFAGCGEVAQDRGGAAQRPRDHRRQ